MRWRGLSGRGPIGRVAGSSGGSCGRRRGAGCSRTGTGRPAWARPGSAAVAAPPARFGLGVTSAGRCRRGGGPSRRWARGSWRRRRRDRGSCWSCCLPLSAAGDDTGGLRNRSTCAERRASNPFGIRRKMEGRAGLRISSSLSSRRRRWTTWQSHLGGREVLRTGPIERTVLAGRAGE